MLLKDLKPGCLTGCLISCRHTKGEASKSLQNSSSSNFEPATDLEDWMFQEIILVNVLFIIVKGIGVEFSVMGLKVLAG